MSAEPETNPAGVVDREKAPPEVTEPEKNPTKRSVLQKASTEVAEPGIERRPELRGASDEGKQGRDPTARDEEGARIKTNLATSIKGARDC